MNIAFFGLGNMGQRMAVNLLRAGHSIDGFDPNPQAPHDVVAHLHDTPEVSARFANHSSTRSVIGEHTEAVIMVLPKGRHVREVCEQIVFPNFRAEKGLIIDCSTIDVATARDLATTAATHGLAMLDAPMSGGIGGAEAGTLTFMVGGDDPAVARATAILNCMGKNIVHCGASGAGQGVKICNNMILGASMAVVSEAFGLAEKLGISPQKLYDVASTSSGQCWALTTYCPEPGLVPTSPANRDWQAGFSAGMMLKDLRLAAETAAEAQAAIPVGTQAMQVYSEFVDADDANNNRDFSGIINFIKKLAP